MARYLLISKKSAKVPLLATKSKPYQVKVNDDYTASWNLMDEAWLVTNMYLLNYNPIANSLRAAYPEIGPDEIERFFETVKTDHPVEIIKFNLDDIPVYATKKSYCELFLPWLYKYPVKLTLEQENNLLNIVKDNGLGKRERMIQWFKCYREHYGIESRLKRDRELQDEDLVEMFSLVHGLDFEDIETAHLTEEDKVKGSASASDFSSFISFGWLSISIFILICILGNWSNGWTIFGGISFGLVGLITLALTVIGLIYKDDYYFHYSVKSGFRGFMCLFLIVGVFMGSFGLFYWGITECDSWLLGLLLAVPFLLIMGLIGKFLGITK